MPWIGLDIDGSEILLLGDYPYISDNGKWGFQLREFMACMVNGKEQRGIKLRPGTIQAITGRILTSTDFLMKITEEESKCYLTKLTD